MCEVIKINKLAFAVLVDGEANARFTFTSKVTAGVYARAVNAGKNHEEAYAEARKADEKRKKRNAAARGRHDAMITLGLTKTPCGYE